MLLRPFLYPKESIVYSNMNPEQAQKILAENGQQVTIEMAAKILEFLEKLAKQQMKEFAANTLS